MVVPVYMCRFLLFYHLSLLFYVPNASANQKCPQSFDCGNLDNIRYPFTTTERQDCGLLAIRSCSNSDREAAKSVQLTKSGKWFNVTRIVHKTIVIRDEVFHQRLASSNCGAFSNLLLPPSSPIAYFQIKKNITIFKCNHTLDVSTPRSFIRNTRSCHGYDIYYGPPDGDETQISCFKNCSKIQLPLNGMPISPNPFDFLSDEFPIEVRLSDACIHCRYGRRGQCLLDRKGSFFCAKGRSWVLKLGLGLGLGVAPFILITGLVLLWLYKRKYSSNMQFQSRNKYGDEYPNRNPEPESGRVFFAVPVFSYKELQEATDNFNRTRKLGDGGFGTVYHGKLRDGREVAVKLLHEKNCGRVKQFMNEIEILTCMRHQNLVSLYGCTSHHSRELLLVYEYIPNGTVASHLHGGLSKPGFLPWPIRMKIAIETASALAYLHACDIIHRDVKSNNILLDNNFCVKVADFGLSRLFPVDVTHVSTAPQGTPGYLDPEYHQFYQLTSKSDVYSFGVVLIELISSMPAVDITRHKDDINLANLAIRKIQKCEFSELVDPSLGFESDNEVKRLIVPVGKLAFQCLQRDSELRPSMDEVLKMLKRIENGKDELEEADALHGAGISLNCVHPPPPTSPDSEEFRLLRSSLNIVTDRWENKFITRSVSF